MAHNIGAAIGPIIGAAVVVVSKDVIFLITSGTMLFYTILMLLFLKETKPKNIMIHEETHKQSIRFTLRVVIRDRIFLFYIVTGIIIFMGFSQSEGMLPLHFSNENTMIFWK